jgi:hypothetical protein
MPGRRAPDKETLSFYIPRNMGRRLRKMAHALKVSVTDIVVTMIAREVGHIELTPEDEKEIAAAISNAERWSGKASKHRSTPPNAGAL